MERLIALHHQDNKERRNPLQVQEYPLISIGLPTYNRAISLKKCVESVLNQSYSNWELLISDDASSDNTREIVQSLSFLDNRIRYIFNEKNLGLPANRNSICTHAMGDFIFFIEDDLQLDPSCLENLVSEYFQLSRINKIGAIAPRLIEENTEFKSDLNNPDITGIVELNRFTGEVRCNYNYDSSGPLELVTLHACSFLEKRVWKEIGGYSSNSYTGTYSHEETDFFWRLRSHGYKLFYIPQAVTYHHKGVSGGCRINTPRKYYYYFFNHCTFLIKNFKIKSVWMIPFFILFGIKKKTMMIFQGREEI